MENNLTLSSVILERLANDWDTWSYKQERLQLSNCNLSFAGLHYCKIMHHPLVSLFPFGTLSAMSLSARPLRDIRPYYHFSALARWISLNLWFTTRDCILSPGTFGHVWRHFYFLLLGCWYCYLVGKETKDTAKQ